MLILVISFVCVCRDGYGVGVCVCVCGIYDYSVYPFLYLLEILLSLMTFGKFNTFYGVLLFPINLELIEINHSMSVLLL